MSNEEHVALLRRGVRAWDAWREENSDVHLDLTARFIVADLTDPSSVPKELEAIVPTFAVPVQPLIEGLDRPYAMFKDYWKYDWVLPESAGHRCGRQQPGEE